MNKILGFLSKNQTNEDEKSDKKSENHQNNINLDGEENKIVQENTQISNSYNDRVENEQKIDNQEIQFQQSLTKSELTSYFENMAVQMQNQINIKLQENQELIPIFKQQLKQVQEENQRLKKTQDLNNKKDQQIKKLNKEVSNLKDKLLDCQENIINMTKLQEDKLLDLQEYYKKIINQKDEEIKELNIKLITAQNSQNQIMQQQLQGTGIDSVQQEENQQTQGFEPSDKKDQDSKASSKFQDSNISDYGSMVQQLSQIKTEDNKEIVEDLMIKFLKLEKQAQGIQYQTNNGLKYQNENLYQQQQQQESLMEQNNYLNLQLHPYQEQYQVKPFQKLEPDQKDINY